MMEGLRNQHLHQEWQEPLEELSRQLGRCLLMLLHLKISSIGHHTSSLDTDLTRNTRAPHFTPQHWLLCHMGLY